MKNPLVVGYRGEIGSYILSGLIKYMPSAIPIMCYDKNDTLEEKRERIKKADVIFLCVPMQYSLGWFDIFQKELQGKVVVEQTSLKGPLYTHPRFKSLTKGITIYSMHLLFRPSSTPDPKDRMVVYVASNQTYIWDDMHKLGIPWFVRDGLNVPNLWVFQNWKEHDTEMALQQALVHRVLLVLGEMLEPKKHHDGNKYEKYTYMGKQVNKLRLRIQQGDIELYKLIQDNPYLERKLKEFDKKLKNFNLVKQMQRPKDD